MGATTVSTSTRLVQPGYQVMPIHVQLADLTAAGVFFKWTPGFPGKIVSLDFVTCKAVTTASKAATVTPAIGGTSLSGCAVALISGSGATGAATIGNKIAGSAAPASGNTFSATDEVSLVSSSVTAFAEGSGTLLLGIETGFQN